MTTQIEQARLELAKWEARVSEDATALANAERHAFDVIDEIAAEYE